MAYKMSCAAEGEFGSEDVAELKRDLASLPELHAFDTERQDRMRRRLERASDLHASRDEMLRELSQFNSYHGGRRTAEIPTAS